MAEQFTETVEILNAASAVTITLDANTASLRAGGNGQIGDLEFRNGNGDLRAILNGAGLLRIYNDAGNIAASIVASTGTVELGTSGQNTHIRLVGNGGNIIAGDNGQDGDIQLLSSAGEDRIRLDAAGANVYVGGNGTDGDIVLFPTSGDNVAVAESSIHLDGGNASLAIRASGQITARMNSGGNVYLGGHGHDGDVILFAAEGDNNTLAGARIRLDASGGSIWAGGNGANGDVLVFPSDANDLTNSDQATIALRGSDGDIILRNADCAEDFDVSEGVEIAPGTVVAIDENGDLRECSEPYQRTVAGVISGAGEFSPGIRLDRRDTGKKRLPVALLGKVYCKVDAAYGPIGFGDLLTSSPTPGFAMRASDPGRAFGAVIGKALKPVDSGRNLIPILVALQ